MLTREQNELLCRVEGEAVMGQMMRRHWLPVCMSEEVAEADGAPVRARLLGEDLVVFRNSAKQLGVLGEHCPHRGPSLAFGRNEENGLRCLYHGWKFDVEGNVVDMPSEAPGACERLKMKHISYPAREAGGFIWVWMGPKEKMREFEPPAWAPQPDIRYAIVKIHVSCNWAQVLEGSIDSAHSSSLHSTNMPAADVYGATATDSAWYRPSVDKAPKMQFEPTSYGFRYAAIRKPIRDPETHQYVRSTLFIAPFTVLIPPNNQYNLAQMLVPIDDVNTMFYWIAWHPDPAKGISQEKWREFCAATVGVDLNPDFTKKDRTLATRFLQDREAMKRGDFTGIKGIPFQDMAMWESMGPIADRSKDHPGQSDVAVVQFRRMMIAAARKFQDGAPALGTTDPHIPHVQLGSFEGVVPRTTDWKTLGVPAADALVTAK